MVAMVHVNILTKVCLDTFYAHIQQGLQKRILVPRSGLIVGKIDGTGIVKGGEVGSLPLAPSCRGRIRGGIERLDNTILHMVNVLQDFFIGKSDDTESFRFQIFCPNLVYLLLIGLQMISSINFDYKTTRQTSKICNIITNGMLPSEFHAQSLSP